MISTQALIFILVGALSAAIDIGLMQSLIHLGSHFALATSIGFAGGLVANYFLHSKVTFKSRTNFQSIIKFFIVVAINYALTLVFVYCSQSWFSSAILGKIISLPVVAGNGFLLSKFWVFK